MRNSECGCSVEPVALFLFLAQGHRRMEFRFRLRAGHGLMHRVRAKVNAARPFHAAEIRIDGDGVENFGIEQFQKHAATPAGFNGKNPADTVVESDFQPALRQRFGGNDPNHGFILLQRRDFGRFLIAAGQFPSLPQFRAMQRRPFEDERPRPPAHVKWTPEFGPDGELDFSGFAEHETTAGL
jgi:hypothetical protein